MSIYDNGFNNLLTKDPLFSDTVNSANAFSDGTTPKSLTSGELTGNLVMADGYMQSGNFVTGSAGWKIDKDGNVEFSDGTFRGDVKVSALSYSKLTLQSNFESITGLSTFLTGGTGSVGCSLGRMTISATVDTASAALLCDVLNAYPLKEKNPLFETEMRASVPLATDVLTFGCLQSSFITYSGLYDGVDLGFGFAISNNDVYAFIDGTLTLISGIDASSYASHIYRGEYTHSTGTVNLYVDGNLVYTTTGYTFKDVIYGTATTYSVNVNSPSGAGGILALSSRFVYQQDL